MAKRRQRRMFTAAESAEVWDRWQRGEGLKVIGRVLGKTSSVIFAHLKPHGGIRPAPRRRSRRMLSLDEREEISRGMAAGVSLRSVARRLGRAPSTISRELRRNGGHRGYRAAAADNVHETFEQVPLRLEQLAGRNFADIAIVDTLRALEIEIYPPPTDARPWVKFDCVDIFHMKAAHRRNRFFFEKELIGRFRPKLVSGSLEICRVLSKSATYR